MKQLLLTAQNLELQSPLQQGILDIANLLNQYKDLPRINLLYPLPEEDFTLSWNEVAQPQALQGFQGLLGKKLSQYKFQYIGGSKQSQAEVKETFTAYLNKDLVYDYTFTSAKGANLSWLIDFLLNPESKVKEELIWTKVEGNYLLRLIAQYSEEEVEVQSFYFTEDLILQKATYELSQ